MFILGECTVEMATEAGYGVVGFCLRADGWEEVKGVRLGPGLEELVDEPAADCEAETTAQNRCQ